MARLGIDTDTINDLPEYRRSNSYPIPRCGTGIEFEFYGRSGSKLVEKTFDHKDSGTKHAFWSIPLTFLREDTEEVAYWDYGIFIDLDDPMGLAMLKKIVYAVGMAEHFGPDFDPEMLKGIRIQCDVDHNKKGDNAYLDYDSIILLDEDNGGTEEEQAEIDAPEEVTKAKPNRPPRTGRGTR